MLLKRRWTLAEKHTLTALWPRGIPVCVETIGRSSTAVRIMAAQLGLLDQISDTLTIIADDTGYSVKRIKTAARWLNLKLLQPIGEGRAHLYRVTPDQREKIVAFLAAQPDGRNLLSPKAKLTPAAMWGINGKPKRCLGCARTDRPHRAGGRCMPCYQTRQKLWGVDGRGDGCADCGSAARKHYSGGRCKACHGQKRNPRPGDSGTGVYLANSDEVTDEQAAISTR